MTLVTQSASPRSQQLSLMVLRLRGWMAAKIRLHALAGAALVASLMGGALAVRVVGMGTNYDIFGDEIDYVQLGRSALHGNFPPRYQGTPFFLHPPLFFYLEAAWFHLVGMSGSFVHLLNEARLLNILAAVITVGLLYGIGTRLAGRACGAVTALLFAVDPYVLRQNGRAYLETTTMMWVVAGTFVLLPLFSGRSRRPLGGAVVGGLALGLGIVSNEIVALLVVPPLAIALWRRWGPGRRPVAMCLAASIVPFATYVVALLVARQAGPLWQQQLLGLKRMLGLVQETGFNAPGTPSLWHTLWSEVGVYGISYEVCAAGLLASIYLLAWGWLERARPRQRWPRIGSARNLFVEVDDATMFVACVAVFGIATLGYALVFGTIEEQFLYYPFVPCLAIIPVAIRAYVDRRGRTTGKRWSFRWLWAVVALIVVVDASVAGAIRSTSDNGQARLVSWLQTHVPTSSVVGVDSDVTSGVLELYGYRTTALQPPALVTPPLDLPPNQARSEELAWLNDTISDLQTAARLGVRYVALLSTEEAEGYGYIDERQATIYARTGRLMFRFDEATYGTVSVYETTDPQLW